MTLLMCSKDVEIIPSMAKIKCSCCGDRWASYRMESVDSREKVPFCGWCVLYGNSKWGEENRDELLYVGEFVKGVGERSRSHKTNVPKLDKRHRMSPLDADRYLTGIIFTSRAVEKGPFGKLMKMSSKISHGEDDE